MRIATYNIGDYSGATFDRGSDDAKKHLKDLMESAGVDLWAMQEDEKFFNEVTQETPEEALYQSYKYRARYGTGKYNFKSILSNYELTNVQQIYYNGEIRFGHKWFLSAILSFEGKEMCVISLHFDWTDNRIRATQIKQVLEYANKYKYCIIMGDFNPSDYMEKQKLSDNCLLSKEIEPFLEAGYSSVNVGKFGYYGTLPLRAEPFACDNIIVSGNIKILNAGTVLKDWMNDHAVLWADIEIA